MKIFNSFASLDNLVVFFSCSTAAQPNCNQWCHDQQSHYWMFTLLMAITNVGFFACLFLSILTMYWTVTKLNNKKKYSSEVLAVMTWYVFPCSYSNAEQWSHNGRDQSQPVTPVGYISPDRTVLEAELVTGLWDTDWDFTDSVLPKIDEKRKLKKKKDPEKKKTQVLLWGNKKKKSCLNAFSLWKKKKKKRCFWLNVYFVDVNIPCECALTQQMFMGTLLDLCQSVWALFWYPVFVSLFHIGVTSGAAGGACGRRGRQPFRT